MLDAANLCVPVCGKDVEVVERFTYLDSDIHVSAGCEPEVNTESGLGSHGFIGSWGVAVSVPLQEEKNPSLQVLGASSLALRM